MAVISIVLVFVLSLFLLHLTCIIRTYLRAQQYQQQQNIALQNQGTMCSPEDREV